VKLEEPIFSLTFPDDEVTVTDWSFALKQSTTIWTGAIIWWMCVDECQRRQQDLLFCQFLQVRLIKRRPITVFHAEQLDWDIYRSLHSTHVRWTNSCLFYLINFRRNRSHIPAMRYRF
jgi:hypothetical protein